MTNDKKDFSCGHQFSFPGDYCGGDRGAVHGGIHAVREDAEYCGILVSADHDGKHGTDVRGRYHDRGEKNGAIRD